MRDHERHEKLQVLDVFEDEIEEIQTLDVVEEKLELSLDEGYAIFKEEHDSYTLEPIYKKMFHMMKILYFLIIWVSWFFLLHPTLPHFA